MITTPSPSARTVSLVPFRMRGTGVASIACCSEFTTVSAVSSCPLWNVTPWRIVKRHVRASARSHSVARPGSAAPSSSSTTSVSAVAHRDSLNASSLSGVRPERGGCSIAIETRASVAAWSPPDVAGEAKQPPSSRVNESDAARPSLVACAGSVGLVACAEGNINWFPFQRTGVG